VELGCSRYRFLRERSLLGGEGLPDIPLRTHLDRLHYLFLASLGGGHDHRNAAPFRARPDRDEISASFKAIARTVSTKASLCGLAGSAQLVLKPSGLDSANESPLGERALVCRIDGVMLFPVGVPASPNIVLRE
jgi:hypothetical protein